MILSRRLLGVASQGMDTTAHFAADNLRRSTPTHIRSRLAEWPIGRTSASRCGAPHGRIGSCQILGGNTAATALAIAKYPASFGCMFGPNGLGAHIHVNLHSYWTLAVVFSFLETRTRLVSSS